MYQYYDTSFSQFTDLVPRFLEPTVGPPQYPIRNSPLGHISIGYDISALGTTYQHRVRHISIGYDISALGTTYQHWVRHISTGYNTYKHRVRHISAQGTTYQHRVRNISIA